MAWWLLSDPRYFSWCVNNLKMNEIYQFENCEECCYATCSNCNCELYAILRFKDITPVELIEIGKIEDWPDNFLK